MPNQANKLLTILVATKSKSEITSFLRSLNKLVYKPSSIAVAIYLNKNVDAIKKAIKMVKAKFDVIIVDDPIKEVEELGYYGLHSAYNLLIQRAPDSYFYTIFSDEIKFKTKHFDKRLDKYKGYFKDDIFLLRISMFKNIKHNILRGAISSPENYPLVTQKLMSHFYPLKTWGPDSEMGGITYIMKRYFKMDRDVICNSVELERYNFGANVYSINMIIRKYMIGFYHGYLASPAFIIFFIKRACSISKVINPHQLVIPIVAFALLREFFIFFKRSFLHLIKRLCRDLIKRPFIYGLKFLKNILEVCVSALESKSLPPSNQKSIPEKIRMLNVKLIIKPLRQIKRLNATLIIKLIGPPLMALPLFTCNLMLTLKLYYKVIIKFASLLKK